MTKQHSTLAAKFAEDRIESMVDAGEIECLAKLASKELARQYNAMSSDDLEALVEELAPWLMDEGH